METQNKDIRLDRLLGELGPDDPPAGFTDRTMTRIHGGPEQGRRAQPSVGQTTSIMFGTGGTAMRKRLMWALAAAAAIVLAFFAIRGFPTVDQGSEATIGAAKRYQAGQIANKDVVLGDQSVQQFMQSDVFDRLVKDPAAVKALSDASIRLRIADASLLKALGDPQLVASVKMYANTALLSGLSCDGCRLALESAEVQTALQEASFVMALQDLEFISALQDAKIAGALAKHDLEAALSHVKLQASLTNPRISLALQSEAFLKAIKNLQFVNAVQDVGFLTAVQNPAFLLAVSDARLTAAVQSEVFQSAIRVAGFDAALHAQSFAAAMSVGAAQLAQ
jgi:hypothetical protein